MFIHWASSLHLYRLGNQIPISSLKCCLLYWVLQDISTILKIWTRCHLFERNHTKQLKRFKTLAIPRWGESPLNRKSECPWPLAAELHLRYSIPTSSSYLSSHGLLIPLNNYKDPSMQGPRLSTRLPPHQEQGDWSIWLCIPRTPASPKYWVLKTDSGSNS